MNLLQRDLIVVEDFDLDKVTRRGLVEFRDEIRGWRTGGLFTEDAPLNLLVLAVELRCEEILKRKKVTVAD